MKFGDCDCEALVISNKTFSATLLTNRFGQKVEWGSVTILILVAFIGLDQSISQPNDAFRSGSDFVFVGNHNDRFAFGV